MSEVLRAVERIRDRYGDRLPCSVLVARALALMADAEDLYRPRTRWWEDAQIYDAARLYSSLDAAAEVVRHVTRTDPSSHCIFKGSTAPELAVRALAPAAVYVVQGWRRDSTGHNFFLITHPRSPYGCKIVESSESAGTRVGGEAWGREHGFEYSPERLRPFDRGVGIVRLWDA